MDFKKINKGITHLKQTINTPRVCEWWAVDGVRGVRVWNTGEVRARCNGTPINKDFNPNDDQVEQKIIDWILSL